MQDLATRSSDDGARGRNAVRIDTLYRWAYVVCAFTGLRAAFNRAWCRLLRGGTSVDRLQEARIQAGRCGTLRVAVHRRARVGTPRFGMVSLRQERPRMNRVLYRYLCLTSHFGCGHVEVAFYEAAGQVTLYAVRNSARSHAHRLGWRRIAQRLGSEKDDVDVVRALVERLERVGCSVRLAPARECVELALNRRLVHPRSLRRTRVALEKKYRRLPRALGTPSAVPARGSCVTLPR